MHRTDSNQTEIVKNLRGVGFTVAITSNVGSGFSDIVVGGSMPCVICQNKTPQNRLIEIKSHEKATFTPAQKEFHALWRGRIDTVFSTEQAFDALGVFLRNKDRSAIKSDKQVLLDARRTLLSQQQTLARLLQNIDLQLQN